MSKFHLFLMFHLSKTTKYFLVLNINLKNLKFKKTSKYVVQGEAQYNSESNALVLFQASQKQNKLCEITYQLTLMNSSKKILNNYKFEYKITN